MRDNINIKMRWIHVGKVAKSSLTIFLELLFMHIQHHLAFSFIFSFEVFFFIQEFLGELNKKLFLIYLTLIHIKKIYFHSHDVKYLLIINYTWTHTHNFLLKFISFERKNRINNNFYFFLSFFAYSLIFIKKK